MTAAPPATARRRPPEVALRRSLLALRLRARQPTHSLRALPDFLIVGAQRGGTTSLYRYLSGHPDVIPSLGKETQYFSTRYERGEAWYRAHFPPVARTRAGRRGPRPALTFEATPYYLFHPHAAARAAATVPGAGVIVLVRDPVARAYSHYRHNVRRRLEPLSFEEAVAQEPSRLAGEVERMRDDPGYQSVPHRLFSYVARGMYADQLEGWFAHFPPERVLVLRSEDLFRRTADAYGQALAFLGLAPRALSAFPVHTKGGGGGEPVPEAVRERLRALFAPHNQRLGALLGRDLGWDG